MGEADVAPDPNLQTPPAKLGEYRESVVPKVVDGDGDTPGPKHETKVGRTWVSAQMLGGSGIVAIDVRSPDEWVVGHLEKAILLPPALAATKADLIPGRNTDTMVAVYDADGGEIADEVAGILRELGYRARKLQGGFAEWVEEGEEVFPAPHVEEAAHQVGDAVVLPDGQNGIVWRIDSTGVEPTFDLLVDTKNVHATQGEISG